MPSQIFVSHETLPSEWTTKVLLPGEERQIAPGLWLKFCDQPYDADGLIFPSLVVTRK